MKKIVYLLLITLLFVGCKKHKNNKYTTNKSTVIGKWKTERIKIEYYNDNGNLVHSEEEDKMPAKSFFYVEFDDSNNAIYTTLDNDTTAATYAYKGGYLNVSVKDGMGNMKTTFVSQLTENNMTLKLEHTGNLPPDLRPHNPISDQINKAVVYINFVKVK